MNEKWLARAKSMDDSATENFIRTVKAAGYSVAKSSPSEDMHSHIDYFITKAGKTLAVELKSCKRGVESGQILIELLNVQGRLGWLFGKADLIAFEMTDGTFIFANRSRLYWKLRHIFDFYVSKTGISFNKKTSVVDCPEKAISPLIYRRYDRPLEAITYIPLSVVKTCAENIL